MGISKQDFYREWWKCNRCGLFYTRRSYDENSSIYKKKYRDPSLQGESIKDKAFRILKLPPEKSDSAMRAARLKSKVDRVGKAILEWKHKKRKVLDIGAGLNIFLAKFKDSNWICTAVDADQEACKFSERELGIKTVCGFFTPGLVDDTFDLITMIRIIEHTADPLSLIENSLGNLKKTGLLYIEVPDLITASIFDKNRDTFSSPHYMLYDPTTLSMLAQKAGLFVLDAERIREPAGGFTVNVLCCKETAVNNFFKKNNDFS